MRLHLVWTALATLWAAPALAQAPQGCASEGRISFVCLDGPEDLVAIPGTDWVLASALRGEGGLNLIHRRERTVRRAYPLTAPAHDRSAYPGCPGPPDAARAKSVTHGLSLQAAGRGVFTLYAVLHGERESVEVFRLDARRRTPVVTWIGCVPAPPRTWLNAVAALPKGGFVVTNFETGEPRDLSAPPKPLPQGRDTGEAWEWSRAAGWAKVPRSEAAGPNGIEVSRDGKVLYMAAYIDEQLVRISRGAAAPKRDAVRLGFRVDNLRWGPDGRLYAAGRTDKVVTVARIDPASLRSEVVVELPITPGLANGTVALPVGDELWIGSPVSNRVAILPRGGR